MERASQDLAHTRVCVCMNTHMCSCTQEFSDSRICVCIQMDRTILIGASQGCECTYVHMNVL